MPTMKIPSANLRRLKKLAAEAAAKSSSVEGGRHPRADLRGRSTPPPAPRRCQNRVALLALAAAYDSDETRRDAGAGDDGRGAAAAATGLDVGARVLVRAPVAASAGTAAAATQPRALVRAVVVSGVDEDGCLEVVYEGASSLSLPVPFATVRVRRDQIVANANAPRGHRHRPGAGSLLSSRMLRQDPKILARTAI